MVYANRLDNHYLRPLVVLGPHVGGTGFPVLVDVIEIAFRNLVDNFILLSSTQFESA